MAAKEDSLLLPPELMHDTERRFATALAGMCLAVQRATFT
jgi:hypothetical protein